jgi:hypothetical protein
MIVTLHGTYLGCPEIDHVDRWPRDPADKRPTYRGFDYLAEHLAAYGYIALSININDSGNLDFLLAAIAHVSRSRSRWNLCSKRWNKGATMTPTDTSSTRPENMA